MTTVSSTNVNLHVDDTGGDGRPVILIHGWPLSAEAWAPQTRVLADAGYRVIAYDRRGFGRSDKPDGGYDYDTFSDDLAAVIDALSLSDATLVGFSMGGGEVARYASRHAEHGVRSVVFAAAVPPYLLKGPDNPDGPLTQEKADATSQALQADRDAFFDDFTRDFFSVDGTLKVTEAQRQDAIRLCRQADQNAALESMKAWATTDFRPDLANLSVPTLVLHGAGDATVPFDGSGKRTHAAIAHSELVLVPDAPHGFNASHADAFNRALLEFLAD